MAEWPIYTKQIPSTDPLLGRQVGHDPRSRAYAFHATGEPLVSVMHHSEIRTLNQHVGSCTCNTVLKLCTYDHWSTLSTAQKSALMIDPDGMVDDWYRETTANDEFSGAWEPEDTGSSGTSAAKTAVRRGYAKGFQHSFSFTDTLAMLAKRPVGIGVKWFPSFDRPDGFGMVRLVPGQRERGGHEFVLDELNVEDQIVGAQNSWSDDWGIDGRFYFSWADLRRLLDDDGDAVQLTPLDQPAPEPDWDLLLAHDLKPWAYSRKFGVRRLTKAGKAAAASKEWLARKGL